ncbi:MAG: ATP-binding protein [Chloroflexi bacterium]|nr:ATP-binding protein [Chloroflexota bacterium]
MSPSRSTSRERPSLLFVGSAAALSPKASRLLEQSGHRLRVLAPARFRLGLRPRAGSKGAAPPRQNAGGAPAISLYAPPPISREHIQAALTDQKRRLGAELRRATESGAGVRLAAVVLSEAEGAAHWVLAARGPAAKAFPARVTEEALPALAAAQRLEAALVVADLERAAPCPLASTLGARALLLFPLDPRRRLGYLLIACDRPGLPETAQLGAFVQLAVSLRAITNAAALAIQLAATQARYRSLLETIPFLMVLLADDGRVLELNRHMTAELERQGLDPAQVLGRNALSDPNVPESVRTLLRDSLERRTPLSAEKVDLAMPRGQETLRIHSVPLPDLARANWGLMVIAEVTTRYSLITAEAERTERLAAIGRVAASLAHEINNPLQSLRAHLELIRRYRLSPMEREQSLRILEGEVERLDEITRRILGFARPTPEVLQPVSILGVIEQTLALSRNYLQNQNVEFVVSAPNALPPCMAAPGQLIQVFLNIILNAAHAMQGEGKLKIRVRARGEMVELTFTNSGPPIPAESLPHLFEPFFTTRAEGTGLGLSVSHTILQRHHGTIRAANLPQGRGVVFTINLPLIH